MTNHQANHAITFLTICTEINHTQTFVLTHGLNQIIIVAGRKMQKKN